MRYASSSFKQSKTKKRWWQFGKKDQSRLVVQQSESTRFSNPYTKPKRRSVRFPFKTVLASTLFASWFGLMVYLPYFRITQMTFQGLKIIKQEEIEKYVRERYLTPLKWWPKNNYFLVGEASVEDDLLNHFSLNTVAVKKTFPNIMAIQLEEKISSVIYDNGEGYYLLDQNGALLKNLMLSDVKGDPISTSTSSTILANLTTNLTSSTSTVTSTMVVASSTPAQLFHVPNIKAVYAQYDGYPIVYDVRQLTPDKEKSVISGEVIQGILTIFNAFKRNKLATVKYMIVNDPNAGVTITTTDKPWKIIMDPRQDISNQFENIRIITKDNKPSEYIDVRFGERVYWK